MNRALQPRCPHGFTLLEMLVAVTIVVVLMGLLSMAFLQGQRGWVQGERRAEAFQNARRVLSLMSKDLQTAFASTNNGTIAFRGSSTAMYFSTLTSGSDGPQTNALAELTWVGYEFVDDTPAGYLVRKEVPPRRELLPPNGMNSNSLWKDHVYGSATTGSNIVVLTTNVIHKCEFFYTPALVAGQLPRTVRIRLEFIDQKTMDQVLAGASAGLIQTNKYVMETQVYLLSSP